MHFKMMRGVKLREFLQSYLEEFSWRRNSEVSKIGAFELIKEELAVDKCDKEEFSLESLSLNDDEEDLIELDDDDDTNLGFEFTDLTGGNIKELIYEEKVN